MIWKENVTSCPEFGDNESTNYKIQLILFFSVLLTQFYCRHYVSLVSTINEEINEQKDL